MGYLVCTVNASIVLRLTLSHSIVTGALQIKIGTGGPTMALIEREAAKAKVAETILGASEFDEDMRQACYNAIDAVPTIDAAPAVHGRWTFGGDGIIQCSLCEMTYPSQGAFKKAFYPMHYCPNCGARMDGGEEHEAD